MRKKNPFLEEAEAFLRRFRIAFEWDRRGNHVQTRRVLLTNHRIPPVAFLIIETWGMRKTPPFSIR